MAWLTGVTRSAGTSLLMSLETRASFLRQNGLQLLEQGQLVYPFVLPPATILFGAAFRLGQRRNFPSNRWKLATLALHNPNNQTRHRIEVLDDSTFGIPRI